MQSGLRLATQLTELFLQSHDLLPKFVSSTDVYLVVLGEAQEGAARLAKHLRKEGINTELDITGRKLDRQLKTAVKKRIPYMIFVGEDDSKTEVYPLKDTVTTEEEKLSVERIITRVQDRRRRPRASDEDAAFDV